MTKRLAERSNAEVIFHLDHGSWDEVHEAIRLGFHALTGDWRTAPNVEVERCRIARIWSANPIPALLDGESVRLKALTDVRYIPKIARILALPKDPE